MYEEDMYFDPDMLEIPDWLAYTDWKGYLWKNQEGQMVDVRKIDTKYAGNLLRWFDDFFENSICRNFSVVTDEHAAMVKHSTLYQTLLERVVGSDTNYPYRKEV